MEPRIVAVLVCFRLEASWRLISGGDGHSGVFRFMGDGIDNSP